MADAATHHLFRRIYIQRLLLNLSRPNHDVQEMKFRHAAVGTVMFMFP